MSGQCTDRIVARISQSYSDKALDRSPYPTLFRAPLRKRLTAPMGTRLGTQLGTRLGQSSDYLSEPKPTSVCP